MIVKCTKCHHEWQTVAYTGPYYPDAPTYEQEHCDWCGAPGEKIAEDYMDATPEQLDRVKALLEQIATKALPEPAHDDDYIVKADDEET